MDERVLQLQQMKKQYKKLRRRSARPWKIPGCILMHLCFIMGLITLFVLGNHLSWIQYADTHWWEPLKQAVGLPVPYAAIWLFAAEYGILICAVTGLLGVFCLGMSHVRKARVKTTETYLNYRTLKVTLDTEKEESL